MMTHFLAVVEFDSHWSLPDLAAKLAAVINLPLTKEETGRFDEIPAYVGSFGEIQLILFGPPEGEDEHECVLEISFRTSLPIMQAQESSPSFLQPIFIDSEVDSTGHIKCSAQLASLLNTNGFINCKPII